MDRRHSGRSHAELRETLRSTAHNCEQLRNKNSRVHVFDRRAACSRLINLRTLFTEPLPARLSHFQPLLDASPGLREALLRVTTIAQALLVVPRETDDLSGAAPLILVNTHLFFHGNAPHIRNMHVAALLAEAAAIAENLPEGSERPPVIFCGDLNSDLNDGVPGVVAMLQNGRLPADYWDWAYGADFDFGQGKQRPHSAPASDDGTDAAPPPHDTSGPVNTKGIAVTGVDVELPCRFVSSHDLETQRMTNVVPQFEGVLDYIWLQAERLQVRSLAADE